MRDQKLDGGNCRGAKVRKLCFRKWDKVTMDEYSVTGDWFKYNH